MAFFSQRLSQNTFFLLLSNVGGALLSFLLTVLLGRYLGAEGLGTYAGVLAWIYPLSLVSEFGLGTLMVRNVAEAPQLHANYVRASVQVRLGLGGLVAGLILLGAPFLSSNPAVVLGLRLSAPMVIIVPLVSSFSAIFRAHRTMQPVTLLNLGMLCAQVSLTFWELARGGDVIGALVINTLTSLGQLGVAWALYRHYYPNKETLKTAIAPFHLLREALPFALAGILAGIQARLILVGLERFGTISAVGYYTASLRFLEAGRLLPQAFFDALFPVLTRYAEDQRRLQSFFRRVSGALALGATLGAVVLALGAELLILGVYGGDFAEAVAVLQVLAWGFIPLTLKGVRTLYWYAQKQEGFVNRLTLVGLGVQSLFMIAIIPQAGALGAGWVYVLSETVFCLALWGLKPRDTTSPYTQGQ